MTAIETLVAEFIRYWTTDRTPDGCGMCGGIPHSTTCYVGRMATLLGSGTVAASEASGSPGRSAAPSSSAVVPAGETPQADPSYDIERLRAELAVEVKEVARLRADLATTEAEAFKAGWLADRSGNTGLWSFNGQGQCNEALFAEALAAYRAQKGK